MSEAKPSWQTSTFSQVFVGANIFYALFALLVAVTWGNPPNPPKAVRRREVSKSPTGRLSCGRTSRPPTSPPERSAVGVIGFKLPLETAKELIVRGDREAPRPLGGGAGGHGVEDFR